MSPTDTWGTAKLVAADLSRRRETILERYEQALNRAGSPIVTDPVGRRQCLDNAELVLADVVASLQRGQAVVGHGLDVMARRIGATRAAHGIHPSESLAAATELFDEVMATARELFEKYAAPPHAVVDFAVALNASIGARLREAATAYAGFLLQGIQEAHIEERRRVAREIHDRVGQNVAVAQQNLELYNLCASEDRIRAELRISAAQQALNETVASIREVTSDLRMSGPIEGLHKALRAYLESVHLGDVEVCVTVNGDESWASSHIRDQAFLIIREALRNALAHAEPTLILAEVNIAPHELRATIEDNGRGLSERRVGRPGGGGLASMRERAALLGGTVTVTGCLRQGTRVELLVPLERRHHGHTD